MTDARELALSNDIGTHYIRREIGPDWKLSFDEAPSNFEEA
jgi:hypothetical protein